jgi:hypothetical protein
MNYITKFVIRKICNYYIMSNNFKNIYPYHLFIKFIMDNFTKNDEYYLLDVFIFKKCKFNNTIDDFIISLKPYYKTNKLFYLERNMIFKNFVTIIRQLCKIHNIKYTTNIQYTNNSYIIQYCIFIDYHL